ncbi:alpha/beta hydrolase [Actinomycetospora sp. NBRC 106375]|uniref:alpha/beta hydrolase n=1 Tax=Actinomycetospora sp. NBRC 106375 TaxID=3032207 RepID=UPI0025526C74|nr:alpha/beta hydrolase [Actinomycetospora sp. NBRC 106375]
MSGATACESASPLAVRDVMIPGPDGSPEVRVRIFAPEGSANPLPGLVYIHGGGWITGNIEAFDNDCRRIADQARAVVVSVGYRRSPEHRFPAAIEDCYAALEWVTKRAGELRIDPTRLGVGGESAGAGLSACLAILARDRGGPSLSFQYLGVPVLDDTLDHSSAVQFVDTPLLWRNEVRIAWSSYLGDLYGTEDVPPHAAAWRATDLTRLPRTYIYVAEFDPLRDEGLAYAQRLIHAGVHVELRHYPGTFHGAHLFPSAVANRMVADSIDAISRGLHEHATR